MKKSDVLEKCKQICESGGKVVFTNGCFDVLHAGHVKYLEASRALGDFLVVGLNSDHSIKALKGEGRPINIENDRVYMLESLVYVDAVVVFYETEATCLLGEISPDIYTKGGDYSLESLNVDEKKVLESCGADIQFISFAEGLSSTHIIQKLSEES